MRKSLGEQIAEIANKPQVEDFDIENDETVFQHRESDSEFASEDEDNQELEKEHYISVGKSNLRKAIDSGKALQDVQYSGSKSSRADLYGDDEGDAVEDGNEITSEEEEENSESDAVSFRTDSEDDGEAESNSEDGSMASDDESIEESSADERDQEAERKRVALSNIVEKAARQSVKNLSQEMQRDAAKGHAVLEQQKYFDSILDSRIKLQKALTASNRLPLTKGSWNKLLDDDNSILLKNTFTLLEKVMTQCINVRHRFQFDLNIQGEGIDSYKANTKRNFDELCAETEKLDVSLREYRNVVLNRWSTKVNASSGKSALQSSKFKAINQSADAQVESQLAGMPRLLKKTRINRANTKPLLFDEDYGKGLLSHLKTTEDDNQSEDENLDIPKNYDPRKKDSSAFDSTENPYIFNDEDFYRVLLNDLVEKKLSSSQQQGNGVTIAMTSRSQNKLKKNVDTKASKGRKLNFSVQDPISNYETPNNLSLKWSDDQIDEFFAGLLGQRVNFNEDDEAEDSGVEDDDLEKEAIKNDDIQIFG